MQLYLARKNKEFTKVTPLILSMGSVTDVMLSQKLSEPSVLLVTISRKNKQLIEQMRDSDVAIRLVDVESNLDIPFIKKNDSQIDTENGSQIEFISYMSLLAYSKPHYPLNTEINGTINSVVSNLNTNFDFKFIGETGLINYNSGSKNNYELLSEICNRKNLQFRENGFEIYYETKIPSIEVGDYSQLTPTIFINNYFKFKKDLVIIDEPKRKNLSNSIKYYKVVGNIAGSGSSNQSLILDNTAFASGDYPIVNIDNEFYINDSSQEFEDYAILNIQIWQGATMQNLYDLAKIEIEKSKKSYLYQFNIFSHKVFRVGDKIKIDYQSESLPLSIEATIKESKYDYSQRVCMIAISDNPSASLLSGDIKELQSALDIIREQQTTPQ